MVLSACSLSTSTGGDVLDTGTASASPSSKSQIVATHEPTVLATLAPTSTPSYSPPTLTPTATNSPTVTPRPSPTFEPLCPAEAATDILRQFFDAFNSRDVATLDNLFPDETYDGYNHAWARTDLSALRSFSIQDFETADADELMRFFEQQIERNAHYELQYVNIGNSAQQPEAQTPEVNDFGVQFIRQADKLTPRTVVGKGAVNCVDGTIVLFSSGDHLSGAVVEQSTID